MPRETTVYLVRHPARCGHRRPRGAFPRAPTRLDHWCARQRLSPRRSSAGSSSRDPYRPLGEVRIDGNPIEHEAVVSPWASKRGCLHIDGNLWIGPREQLGDDPAGDLLQVGPLLGVGGTVADRRRGSRRLLRRRGAVRLGHHSRPLPALRAGQSARPSCWRSAATGAARASTAGSTSVSSPG